MVYFLLCVLAAAALLLFILLFIVDITSDALYEKNIKGPKTVPFFGHTFRMKTDDLAELTQQHKTDVRTYGSPVRYKFLWSYLLHISSPEHFEAIMKHTKNIAKPLFYGPILPWLHTGLLTSEGDKWHNRRKLLTPAFHFQILREFHSIFNEHAAELVRHVQNRIDAAPDQVIDMAPVITMSTLDIICETAMGRTVNALEAGKGSPYVNALIELGDLVMKRVYSIWLFVNDSVFMMLSHDGRKVKRCLNVLHAFTKETIALREKDLPSSEELKSGGQRRLAFLDLLLDLKRDGKLSAADVAEETDTFMFEGHDTTATALMWIILTLGTYKDCQKKCQEEIDTVVGENFTEISAEQLAQLTYLEQCIKETQRTYPSVPMIGRRVDEEMKLDDHTTLKRGASIQMNIIMLHRNPEHWPEPDRFDPDRFLPDNVAKRHPFAFAPFSAGARNCIGQRFAMTEMKIITAYMLGKFSWETVDKLEDMHGAMMMVLRPERGVNITIRPRY